MTTPAQQDTGAVMQTAAGGGLSGAGPAAAAENRSGTGDLVFLGWLAAIANRCAGKENNRA